MNIAVAGLWHLGSVTAACLAGKGHTVVGYDRDQGTVKQLAAGLPPVAEPGLAALVAEGIKAGRLSFSTDPRTVSTAELLWVCYDTPVDEEDRADIDFVVREVRALFENLRNGVRILVSSQLPVGSVRRLEQLLEADRPGLAAGFASVPENLRLGRAIEVFTRPERIVVGVRRPADRAMLNELLSPLCTNLIWMTVESAEMTKHAINAFLATSVAFANEIAGLCEQVGADASEVEQGLKSDLRIGPRAYLKAGPAFFGGTLARDISYLTGMGKRFALPCPLFNGVHESNARHKEWPRRRLRELLGDLKDKRIAVLGLTYKPGTDTLRRSEAVELCRWLHQQGARPMAYDPAVRSLPADLNGVLTLCGSPADAARGAQALYLATPWPEFADLDGTALAGMMAQPILLDPGRVLKRAPQGGGIRYLTVGSPA